MVEPPNKKQKPIFPILKKAPNAIEGPSLTNSQPAKSKSVYLDKKYRGDFTVSKVWLGNSLASVFPRSEEFYVVTLGIYIGSLGALR